VNVASIYLDHNSTTPIDPRVVEAMARAWSNGGGNPASQHSLGRQARRMLEEAREGILDLLGAKTGGMDADQLIFTSGGTEANNLAILGLTMTAVAESRAAALGGPVPGRLSGPAQDHLIITGIEHPSVRSAAEELRKSGFRIDVAHVFSDGVVNDRFNEWLDAMPRLVSFMLANNETGVIQRVGETASICREMGIPIHTDAVQAVGKIPLNFRDLGVDAMTVAPHKFHGPLGIGALVLRNGVKLKPQMFGGFQQGGIRPGTESVALAIGFHEALRVAHNELAVRAARMQSLRNELEDRLRSEFADLVVIGAEMETIWPRLPNTSCISFPGINRQALVIALDLAGVACSTGSACASGSSEPSATLVAMGLPKPVIEGAVRFSVGAFTTAEEVAEACRRIIRTVKHLRSQK